MSEFVLSDDDVKDIIKFCKKKTPTTQDNVIKCKRIKASKEELDSVNGVKVVFRGDSLLYKPHHAFTQRGDYLRIVFGNGENILYKYDPKSGKLSPYMYETKNKRVFVNNQCKKEYTTLKTNDHDKEKVSWLKNVWSGICSAFIWIWNGICWIGIKIWAGLVWLWHGICWIGINIWNGMVWLWKTIIFWK